MKYFIISISLLILSCGEHTRAQKYIFFLHNKFAQLYPLTESHPQYGRVEYTEIITAFKQRGFTLISELRPKATDGVRYATKVCAQVDSLIKEGVKPADITIIGTSMGGYITKYVSSNLKNKDLNFVLIGCCTDDDVLDDPDIHLYGNVLSIYERSDSGAQSCRQIQLHSTATLGRYKEVELRTGIQHGYLYKTLYDWIEPASRWAQNDYEFTTDNNDPVSVLHYRIDSVLSSKPELPFNGIVAISTNTATNYLRSIGYSDTTRTRLLNYTDQFIIGSISKQITAVLALREFDKGRLQLDVPIKKYLPELQQSWADTVTIHQLMTHTHGIRALDLPTAFTPGTHFEYSPIIGFGLLSKILERTSKKSFIDLSRELFTQCGMNNTTHPALQGQHHLVTGMQLQANGQLRSLPQSNGIIEYAGAAGFISTPEDLRRWNLALHNGKILSDTAYNLFIGKHTSRVHPVVGTSDYGYGISVKDTAGIVMIGHTGASSGFNALNYYFPKSGTSIIILQNLEADPKSIVNSFYYLWHILELVIKCELTKSK